MFGRSKREQMKEQAASASALALQLAQDKKFRKRLLSAIEHSAEAGHRARRNFGLRGTVGRLITDQALLQELKNVKADLAQAYTRLEKKRRRHTLRNVLVVGSLASLALPAARERLAAVLRRAKQGSPKPGPATAAKEGDRSGSGFESASGGRLEELSREELYNRAQEANIPGRSEMTKQQLVEALRSNS